MPSAKIERISKNSHRATTKKSQNKVLDVEDEQNPEEVASKLNQDTQASTDPGNNTSIPMSLRTRNRKIVYYKERHEGEVKPKKSGIKRGKIDSNKRNKNNNVVEDDGLIGAASKGEVSTDAASNEAEPVKKQSKPTETIKLPKVDEDTGETLENQVPAADATKQVDSTNKQKKPRKAPTAKGKLAVDAEVGQDANSIEKDLNEEPQKKSSAQSRNLTSSKASKRKADVLANDVLTNKEEPAKKNGKPKKIGASTKVAETDNANKKRILNDGPEKNSAAKKVIKRRISSTDSIFMEGTKIMSRKTSTAKSTEEKNDGIEIPSSSNKKNIKITKDNKKNQAKEYKKVEVNGEPSKDIEKAEVNSQPPKENEKVPVTVEPPKEIKAKKRHANSTSSKGAKLGKVNEKEEQEDEKVSSTTVLDEVQTQKKQVKAKKTEDVTSDIINTYVDKNKAENVQDNGIVDGIETGFDVATVSNDTKQCEQTIKGSNLNDMKIVSWNVAGMRAWIKKDGLKFIDSENPDIICLQEVKCTLDKIPEEVAPIPSYHPYWNLAPGGYAGVALYSKIMPMNVEYDFGKNVKHETTGRLIAAEFEKFHLINVYVPNSGRKLVNLAERMKWEELFQDYVKRLDALKPVIICGDMNVAHQPIDLANPKTNTRNAGFTQEERDKMSELLKLGLVDTYRHFRPQEVGAYTFWTYMSNSRTRNVGWRLDYFLVAERLLKRVGDSIIRPEYLGSDHCPIVLLLKK